MHASMVCIAPSPDWRVLSALTNGVCLFGLFGYSVVFGYQASQGRGGAATGDPAGGDAQGEVMQT